ncbi:hypothetical protein Rs2_04905 [Raphanus sativus]|nr:hypothetical protein Rs2_04905 [Raphanus sativus]
MPVYSPSSSSVVSIEKNKPTRPQKLVVLADLTFNPPESDDINTSSIQLPTPTFITRLSLFLFIVSKTEKYILMRSSVLANEPNIGFFGGPWPSRAVGSERGHMRRYGGGDWNVIPVGAAIHGLHPNYGDY